MSKKEDLITLTIDTMEDWEIAPRTDEADVIQCVKMIVMTAKYSVPLDRDFGLDVKMIDEPTPKARARLRDEIITAIRKYEPRAVVHSVKFVQSPTDLMDGKLYPVITISVNLEKFKRWNA